MSSIVLTIVWLLAPEAASPPLLPVRTWTGGDGTSWTGHLLTVEEDAVVFRAAESRAEFRRPLADLSPEDREFAKSTCKLVTKLRHPKLGKQASAELARLGVCVVPAIILEMQHKNGREHCIQTLVNIGEPALPFLFRSLDDSQPSPISKPGKKIAKSANKAVVDTAPPAPLEALLRMPPPMLLAAFQREDDALCRQLVEKLEVAATIADRNRPLADERIVNFLVAVYDTSKERNSIRRSAWLALTEISQRDLKGRPTAAIRLFREHAMSDDPVARVEAVSALCIMQFKSPSRGVPGFANVFSVLNGKDAYDHIPRVEERDLVFSTLVDVLTGPGDSPGRRLAVHFFSVRFDTTPDVTMVPGLIRLVECREFPEVNAKAVGLLGRVGPGIRPAIPAINDWSRRAEDRHHELAADTLCRIGPAEPGVIDALLDLAGRCYWNPCSKIIKTLHDYGQTSSEQRERLLHAINGNESLLQKGPGNEYALRDELRRQVQRMRGRR